MKNREKFLFQTSNPAHSECCRKRKEKHALDLMKPQAIASIDFVVLTWVIRLAHPIIALCRRGHYSHYDSKAKRLLDVITTYGVLHMIIYPTPKLNCQNRHTYKSEVTDEGDYLRFSIQFCGPSSLKTSNLLWQLKFASALTTDVGFLLAMALRHELGFCLLAMFFKKMNTKPRPTTFDFDI